MITIKDYVETPIKIRSDSIVNYNFSQLIHNKIVDANKDLIKYLDNPNDAFKYSICSGRCIDTHCPICGYKKKMVVANLSLQGFGCPICGDGVKYPNKFITELLSQLNINFVREATKKHKDLFWAKSFRYDFYIKHKSYRVLIEADGGFHRYQYQQEYDKRKNELALQHGFTIIRIDCDYKEQNRFDYIKKHIMDSELKYLLDFQNVDWEMCNARATNSIIYDACELWNKGKSTREIGIILNVCIQTVAKYLKKGKEIGICVSYNKEESKKRTQYRSILCYDEEHTIAAFKDANELVKLSNVYFGKQLSKEGVYNVCNGRRKTYYGLSFKYITKEEYEQYKMINNNEVIFQEVA